MNAKSAARPVRRLHTREKGFILILVVGMLTVLVVLGLSYAEQGRVALRGASNARDLAALDGLAETGFQFALRALRDDRNVKQVSGTPAHVTSLGGSGWSTRWGYNPDETLGGSLPSGADRAPSRASAYNYQDTWRMLFWNEETVEPVATWTGKAWGYGFKFRPGNDTQAKRSMETQRYPQPPSVLLDTVQLQPFARVRKFRVQVGSSCGLVQVGVTPKDGGLNLNDVFDPGTAVENPGIYETLPSGREGTVGYGAPWEVAVADARVPYASPDRRTLEYLIGKPPAYARNNSETSYYYRFDGSSLRTLSGSAQRDNGLYNWRQFFEPYGGNRVYAGSSFDRQWRWTGVGHLTAMSSGAPTQIWNVAGGDQPNRFTLEFTRQIMWIPQTGMAYRYDGEYGKNGIGLLVDPSHSGSDEAKSYMWFPSGIISGDPRLPATDTELTRDSLFSGFGFDRFNPYRAGMEAVPDDIRVSYGGYCGAGGYGHPKARTFQLHYMNAVANGRFWTDLLAAWYFGGAPGYTNYLGATQSSGYNNWAHLGSSYDALGIGTHWMPPTSHVWMPGFFSQGRISTSTNYQTRGGSNITTLGGKDETSRGLFRWPGAMPPARMAATYLVPMARWPADFIGQSNAHFTFNSFRLSIRAHGIQENWGDPLAPGSVNADPAKNSWYDAVDVNNSNFAVVYGLLTPEKIPSMLNRTIVAPHLHWKARMLDAECRLKRPVKLDGSAYAYDDVENSWIPVQLGLRTPDAGLPFPGAVWDGDPDSGAYNPWIPLRMKLSNPDKPWHPTDNVWVEPKLLRPGTAYDPLTNPLYNTAAFLAELKNDDAKRHDFIKYPWMPSLKVPVVTFNGSECLNVGLYGFDDPDLLAQVAAGNTNWSKWIEEEQPSPAGSGDLARFPYLPIDAYGAAPTWMEPLPFNGATPYPSPGWNGYLFEPRWYTGRTVNPKALKDLRDADTLANLAPCFGLPGQAANGGGPSSVQSANDPSNPWDFAAHATDLKVEGGLGALSNHRHIEPGRPNVVWGKMDFLTPEPLEYYDLNGDLLGYGSGRPADDVFVDAHQDLSLQDNFQTEAWYSSQPHASAMARPDDFRNWHDWFNQRKRTIAADPNGVNYGADVFRPSSTNVKGKLIWRNKDPNWGWSNAVVSDGKTYSNTSDATFADPVVASPPLPNAPARPRVVRGATRNYNNWMDWSGNPEPEVKPHSLHGLPNPDYLTLYPGIAASQHWADQFRRYVPVQMEEIDGAGDPYDDPDNNPETMTNNPFPGAMPRRYKLIDDPGLAGDPATHTAINPAIPVPRALKGDDDTPVVPGVSKDDAWRVTRVGLRYQEIIANEILDYQVNPWWPNPCVPVTELCVPLDKATYPSEPRAMVKVQALAGSNRWRSYAEHMTANGATVGARVPKYYAYFNRFWCRTNHKAVRNWGGDPNDPSRPIGEPYRAVTIKGNAAAGVPDELINATEGKGMYPPTWQYFGQYPPKEATFQDQISDCPYNIAEDQLGDDFRYLAQAVVLMTEPQMQMAPGRNHPFRNWADFVGFLGHLVYRAPMDPKATATLAAANPKAVRDTLDGVDAWAVCHGSNADARNQTRFFDGSKICDNAAGGGTIYADCLKAPVVAKAGYWPLAANYGRAPEAGADPYYPSVPGTGGWTAAEWKRRWDELRGRDEAGIRVEHHYISERAANDVLVSLSNGRIGPIDFDGDGHVTMTRGYGRELATVPKPRGSNPGGINEMANAKPSGDVPQQRVLHSGWSDPRAPNWELPHGYPWHQQSGADATVEFEEFDDEPTYDTAFANRSFWDTDGDPKTMAPLNLKLGVVPKHDIRLWRKANKREIIQNCVTQPIKFRSLTFRITVAVELTDATYTEVYATRRFQKVVSRVPDTSGALTGEFIEHSSRAIAGVDPELDWLGVQ
ncbi:MAG: hypothetical protein L6R28_18750 [Planctomycetes bacterium]|nr:hypothetical protein [Planctomycetota bacterium]